MAETLDFISGMALVIGLTMIGVSVIATLASLFAD